MLGPNGSGKTTLIRMLLGLTRPTAGRAELLGHPIPDGAAQALPRVGALVEGPGFHPFLTGRENLQPGGGHRADAGQPADIPAAVKAALERVGLADAADRRYRGYSLGMKQRLGLAAALLLPRCLVVLDEPTNGLDPAGTRDVRRIIAELHDERGHGDRLLAPAGRGGGHLHARGRAAVRLAGRRRRAALAAGHRRRRPGDRHPGRRAGPAHAARGRRHRLPGPGPGARGGGRRRRPARPRRPSRCWSAPGSRCTRRGAAGPTWTSCSPSSPRRPDDHRPSCVADGLGAAQRPARPAARLRAALGAAPAADAGAARGVRADPGADRDRGGGRGPVRARADRRDRRQRAGAAGGRDDPRAGPAAAAGRGHGRRRRDRRRVGAAARCAG